MYCSYYNLKCKPFQLNTDPEFFFQSSMHKSAIAYMRYGLMQGEGFVVITGFPGLGKTMLVRELVKNLNDDDIVIGVMVSSQVGATDTLRVISGTFGLSFVDLDKATLLVNIEQFIKTTSENGKRILLIVDEAQNLPKQSLEELRMLSNFERNGKIIFQTFLVGQKELRHTIFARDMDQFKQRIVSAFQLKPLNALQTKEYILFRLGKAGWDHKPEFNDDIFQKIHDFTNGVPRKINTLCDRILFYGYSSELDAIDIESVDKVIFELEEEMIEDVESFKKVVSDLGDQIADVNEAGDEEDIYPILSHEQEDSALVSRISRVEQKLEKLHASHRKEKKLLRKTIMIQLDMDDED